MVKVKFLNVMAAGLLLLSGCATNTTPFVPVPVKMYAGDVLPDSQVVTLHPPCY